MTVLSWLFRRNETVSLDREINFSSQSCIKDRISVVIDEASIMVLKFEQMCEMPDSGTVVESRALRPSMVCRDRASPSANLRRPSA